MTRILILINCILPSSVFSQSFLNPFKTNINETKGTIVLSEIINQRNLYSDSSVIMIRLFDLNCNRILGDDLISGNILIDGELLKISNEGDLSKNVAIGRHSIGFRENSGVYGINEKSIKIIQSNKRYLLNIYVMRKPYQYVH